MISLLRRCLRDALAGLAAVFTMATMAHAGVISLDFNSGQPAGTTLFGDATVDSGVLKLTNADFGQLGYFYLNSDLDGGAPVTNFTATYQALIGGGSGADGMSFNFASDLPANPTAPAINAEEGIGTGLSINFDTFNFGVDDPLGLPFGPSTQSVDIEWAGNLIGRVVGPVSQGSNGTSFFDVFIQLDPDGTIDVVYNGIAKFTDFQTGYVPISGGRFALGARTGGASDNHWIDDLTITTNAASAVPEPGTLALAGVGVTGLLCYARRRQRRASGRR